MKRLFDCLAALTSLMLLSPVLVVVAAAVKIDDRGPVFYRGTRVGRDGRRFGMFKFRTMVVNADRTGGTSTAADDPRLTAVGKILRAYKLDEVPQLINVLIGDMSLVGPRPQVPWAVDLYTPSERALLTVRPGMTDYASIRFANEADILAGAADPDATYLERIAPEKIRLGLEYVRHRSTWIDLKIIAATLWSLAGGDPQRILGHQI